MTCLNNALDELMAYLATSSEPSGARTLEGGIQVSPRAPRSADFACEGRWDVSYPEHPNKEPPFPETSPCFVCGREKGHDLTKHVNPALGTPVPRTDSGRP